jgi:hypothetical protein
MAMDSVIIGLGSVDDRQKRRAACDECRMIMLVSNAQRTCSSNGRVEEAQMLRRTANLLEVPDGVNNVYILSAKADGPTEKATTRRE